MEWLSKLISRILSLFKSSAAEEIEKSDPPSVFVPVKITGQEDAIQRLKTYSISRGISPKHYAIVDFNINSDKPRLFLFDSSFGLVKAYLVSHGRGRQLKQNDQLVAKHFSNTPGSLLSSLGVYRCAEVYFGKHGRSLRIDGLEESNSNARSRAVVIHAADYVTKDRAGRSEGCFAVSDDSIDEIIDALKDGGLLLAYK